MIAAQNQQQGQQTSFVSNHFEIDYIKDIQRQDDIIDKIFETRMSAGQIQALVASDKDLGEKAIMTSKPAVANSVFPLIIISIIILPLIVLLPITLFFTIWSVKVKSYAVESNRVIAYSGIFFKKKKSVLMNRIDHINSSQGFLNKMFSNGTVSINTTGSSGVEMNIRAIADFKEFYKEIQKHY
jgi:membrane protein YdbS with pleckstrin-like domain